MKKLIVVAVLFVTAMGLAVAQRASIDFKYNVLADATGNYVNWSADGKSVKDTFDAASGASKAQSTEEFNVVRYDASGKLKATPQGLRNLLLYPVSPRSVADNDNLSVQENGKQLVITFIHRNNAFRITTDASGKLNMDSCFEVAANVAENVGGKFILKEEFVKEGGDATVMADADWSKLPLAKDVADADASYKYVGELKTTYKKGVLTIKGNLKK